MPLFVGAISGTSIDGLDLALVEIDEEQIQLLQAETADFPASLRNRLDRLANSDNTDLQVLGHTHAALGAYIGKAIKTFLERSPINSKEVRAIGSHGQTIHHYPSGGEAFSLQIGDASRIAEITRLDTIADFRSRDIAAGGVGAPLVPIFHQRLFHDNHRDRIVLNIGGIANITNLPANHAPEHVGFDTGPGNCLIDAYVKEKFNQDCDLGGRIAATGTTDLKLLDQLMSDEWLTRRPPKSTGREHFNYEYVRHAIRKTGVQLDNADIVATLTEFTALTIRDAITEWCHLSGDLIVCGGGRLNAHLMRRIAQNCPDYEVLPCESLKVDGDAVEAAAFAYLAYLHVNNCAGNVPEVTGAQGGRVLGCLYPA